VIESVRVRLALWHTTVVAILLVALATAAYTFVSRMTARRLDQYLEETAAAFGTELTAQRFETPTDFAAAVEALKEFDFRGLHMGVIDPQGHIVKMNAAVDQSPSAREDSLPPFDPAPLGRVIAHMHLTASELLTIPDSTGGVRAALSPVKIGANPYVIVVARPLAPQRKMLASVRTVLLIIIPISLVLAGAGGYLLTRRILSPVMAMSERASRIGTSTLHERLPVRNARDEYGQLAGVFNSLLSRLESAFEQQRRFMADASHELRTPIAIVRGEADIALAVADRRPEEYRESLTVVRAEARRLSRIVHDLFLLARVDTGQQQLQLSHFYLDELIVDCAHNARSLASRRGMTVYTHVSHEAPVRGDEDLIQRLILNLLDNAIKYSREGGQVDITLTRDVGCHRVIVHDNGPGIPPDIAAHIFERFYRADSSRTREATPASSTDDDVSRTAGAGLGLAIARWVAEAHGGSLVLAHSSESGSEFVFTLPELQEG
jgi:two-component system, OmpR family, sensor kinase